MQSLGRSLLTWRAALWVLDKSREDLGAHSTKEPFRREKAAGRRAGLTRHPWFAIDGSTLVPSNIKDFKTAIDVGL